MVNGIDLKIGNMKTLVESILGSTKTGLYSLVEKFYSYLNLKSSDYEIDKGGVREITGDNWPGIPYKIKNGKLFLRQSPTSQLFFSDGVKIKECRHETICFYDDVFPNCFDGTEFCCQKGVRIEFLFDNDEKRVFNFIEELLKHCTFSTKVIISTGLSTNSIAHLTNHNWGDIDIEITINNAKNNNLIFGDIKNCTCNSLKIRNYSGKVFTLGYSEEDYNKSNVTTGVKILSTALLQDTTNKSLYEISGYKIDFEYLNKRFETLSKNNNINKLCLPFLSIYCVSIFYDKPEKRFDIEVIDVDKQKRIKKFKK